MANVLRVHGVCSCGTNGDPGSSLLVPQSGGRGTRTHKPLRATVFKAAQLDPDPYQPELSASNRAPNPLRCIQADPISLISSRSENVMGMSKRLDHERNDKETLMDILIIHRVIYPGRRRSSCSISVRSSWF